MVLTKDLHHSQRVAIEPNRLLQIFVNLLHNSVQALENNAEDQERLIHIITADSNDTVSIEIQDTGCGIPERFQERIFDPFFTTSGARGGGTGGIEAARIISEFEDQGSIVYTTGKAILDNLKESIGNTTAHFLSRPFNLQELQALIKGLLLPAF